MAKINDIQAYVVAVVGGAALWQATAMLTGRREAWDSPIYWMVAYRRTQSNFARGLAIDIPYGHGRE